MKRPWLLKSFGAFAALYAGLAMALYFFQERLLFLPDDQSFEECPQMTSKGAIPSWIGSEADGVRYYLREKRDSKSWFLVFHGNAGSACDRAYHLEALGDLPVNIAILEYPGYSAHPVAPTQAAILAHAERLTTWARGQGGAETKMVIYGESLGSGVATYVAAHSPQGIRGIILQTPYTSIADIGADRYFFLPVRWLARHPFPAQEWAARVDAPVLAMHSRDDRTIPFEIGERAVQSFRNVEEFAVFEGMGHAGFRKLAPERYWGLVRGFVQKHLLQR